MSANAWRQDFPLLQHAIDGQPIRYLDSAATALKPRAVIEAERRYSEEITANIHRGLHRLTEEASLAHEEARATLARFFGTVPRALIFTRNTTESLNLVAGGLGLSSKDVVLVPSAAEHNSNLAPWMHRARLVCADLDPLAPIEPAALARALDEHRPRVLALAQASHVTGVVHPVRELCALARERGVLTVVDAAQAAPHLLAKVSELGCDLLAASGHKMLGPTGIGVLTGRVEVLETLAPQLVGGGMLDRLSLEGMSYQRLPQRLEAGTPHISGALGLAAAADYLLRIGCEALARHEAELADALARGLAKVPGIEVLSATSGPRLPLASIGLRSGSLTADTVARSLSDAHQIMARSGYHCAHAFFGRAPGALRISAYLYNTVDEIELACEALAKLTAMLQAR